MKLNIGCGSNAKEWPQGFKNVDVYPPYEEKVDLSVMPWKWESSSVDEIRCWSVMEHMADRWKCIQECHRVLKIGGLLDLRVPHAHGIYAYSLDHTNYWTRLTFNILDAPNPMNDMKPLFCTTKYSVKVRHCHPMPVLDYLATKFPYAWESIGVCPPAMIHWIGKKI